MDFDVRAHRDAFYRYIRRGTERLLLGFGLFLVVVAVAAVFTFRAGSSSDTVFEGTVFLGGFAILGVWAWMRQGSGRLTTMVRVDSTGVTLFPTRGLPLELRWTDPAFSLDLSDFQHPEQRPSQGGYLERYFLWRGANQSQSLGSVSPEAFAAILGGAGQNRMMTKQTVLDRGAWNEKLLYEIRGPSAMSATR